MGKIVGLGVLGVVGLFIVWFIGATLSFRTDCVGAEAGIKAQYEQNQNNYDNMWKSFKELAQVPAMAEKQVEKLYRATMEGRYGKNGSQSLLQMITEQNPQLDSAMYTKIQSAIEAGRKSFAADQTQLIAKKQQYEILLNSNRALVVNIPLGYPKIDLAQFGIVTSDETQDAFKKKKADQIKLDE